MADTDCLGCTILIILTVGGFALVGGVVMVWNALACFSSHSRVASSRILRIGALGAGPPLFLVGCLWLLGQADPEPLPFVILPLAGAGATVTAVEVWREFF